MSNAGSVIIKKKRHVQAAAHHGGAWKVAYADFVTAMMAFFLMMWLLNATTEDQRQGLADYFSPSVPVSRESGGSDSMLNGSTLMESETLIGPPAEAAAPEPGDARDAALEEIADKLDASSGESTVADQLLQHIAVRTTDEGLIVDLFDLPGAPLFMPGTDVPTPLMEELVAVVDDIFAYAENRVAVNGHVRSEAIVRRDRDAWGLSTDRAERVRRMVVGGRTAPARLDRIGGFADASPVHPDRMDVRNNRIEMILLRRP